MIYRLVNKQMKKALTVFTLLVALCTWANAQVTQQQVFVSNELFVRFAKGVVQDATAYIPNPNHPHTGKSVWELIKSYGGEKMINPFPSSVESTKELYRVTLKEGSDIDGLIKALNAHDEVEHAERIPVAIQQYVPADYDESKQWYFKTIKMSWTGFQRSGFEIDIAVIDDGVRHTHEDLWAKLMLSDEDKRFNAVASPGRDDDNNGYIDDMYGWDVADNDNNPMPPVRPSGPDGERLPKSFGNHGTHIAGILGAADNNIGITSLGINNRILCIKAVRDADAIQNPFNLTHYIEGIYYAIAKGVDIINCSWGTNVWSEELSKAINEARKHNIIIVAAAGNYGTENPNYVVDDFYPAALDGVIAVGATDQNDKKYRTSSFGSYVDVMAPGLNIYSTVATNDYSYDNMTGTSMAAPIVSSLIGLLLSQNPDWKPHIERILKETCDNISAQNPNFEGRLGAGRINVDKSINYTGDLTSVSVVSPTGDFTVYPNPANTSITLPFESLSNNGDALQVSIFNISGVLVAQQTIAQTNQHIKVTELPQGIYNISVSNGTAYYQTRLLVNR